MPPIRFAALAEIPAPPRAGQDWPAFVALVGQLRGGKAGWPAELERARLWYEPHLERIHEDAPTRRADLLQLEQIASGYPSRERFLTELTLDPPDATSDQAGVPLLDEDYLILSTIHSAKGQEWTSVFVLNVVDGCIPSDLGTGTTRGDRGGAPAALRGDDAGQGQPPPRRAAALLHARAVRNRRPARLCGAHPLHSRRPRFRCSSGRPGRSSSRARQPPAPPSRARGSTSAPACAACGDRFSRCRDAVRPEFSTSLPARPLTNGRRPVQHSLHLRLGVFR